MSRRKSDESLYLLWDCFLSTPWWTCPLLAALAYVILAFIIPSILSMHPMLEKVSHMPRILAPWAVVLIVLTALAAWARRLSGSLLLDDQRGEDTVRNLTWSEFEQLTAAAFRRQGYRVMENCGGGPDGGIDLVLVRGDERVLVQCKHWRTSKVGVGLVRELYGITRSREHAGSRGCFVTFGHYTSDAREFARANGIELVDSQGLLKLIESARETQPALRKTEEALPSCPECGSPMVVRTARRGTRVGSDFLGCSRYPSCRGTREL